MTEQTRPRVGMSLADYIEQSSARPFELINGKRVVKVATGSEHTELVRALFLLLYLFATPRRLGEVFFEATFVLPDRYDADWVTGSRIPDVLFFAAERFAAYQAAYPDRGRKPYPLVPDLAVEVISPTDKAKAVQDKIDAYLADGVPLLWVFTPDQPGVAVYRDGDPTPTLFGPTDTLTGGDALPGFTLNLAELFATTA